MESAGRDAVLGEGPRWEIVVSPSVIRVRTRDYARAERTYERQLRRHQAAVDMAVTYLRDGDDAPEPLPTPGTIYAWSPRSRARLVARLSDLDYTRLYGRYRTCSDCGTDYVKSAQVHPSGKRHGQTRPQLLHLSCEDWDQKLRFTAVMARCHGKRWTKSLPLPGSWGG
jgi:hypothetical protein